MQKIPICIPNDGNTKTAEAERFEIHDVKDPTDGEWHCGVTAKDWASGGKIVNAMNKGDTITLTMMHRRQANIQ